MKLTDVELDISLISVSNNLAYEQNDVRMGLDESVKFIKKFPVTLIVIA